MITVEDGIRQGGAGMFLADALRRSARGGAAPPVTSLGIAPLVHRPGQAGPHPGRARPRRPGLARAARAAVRAVDGRPRALRRSTRPAPAGQGDQQRRPRLTARWCRGPSAVFAARIETCSTDWPMTFNLADLFEAAVDAFGDREYLVAAGDRRTYAEMEERANRLAHYLADHGIGPGDHVGIYSLNSVEWVETAWAVFKLRAVWININYRYVKDELRYLFTNADLVALVHQAEFGPRVAELLPELPDLRLVVTIDDGSGEPLPARSGPLRGGHGGGSAPSATSPPARATTTTSSTPAGRPACPRAWCGGTRTSSTPSAAASTRPPTPGSSGPRRWSRRARGGQLTLLPIAPLMHGATQWSVMGQSFVGNRTILVPKFDPHDGVAAGRDARRPTR